MKKIIFFPGIPRLEAEFEKRFLQKLRDEFEVAVFNGDIKNTPLADYYIMYSAGAMQLAELVRLQKLSWAKKIIFIAPAGLSLNRNVAKHIWRYMGEVLGLAMSEPTLASKVIRESIGISLMTIRLIVGFDLRAIERKIFGRWTYFYLLEFSSDRLTCELDLPRARKITLPGGHFGILINPEVVNQIKKILKG